VTPELKIADVTQWYSPTSGGIKTYLHAKSEYADRTTTAHALVVTGPRNAQGHLASSRLITVRGRTATERWGYRLAVSAHGIIAALNDLLPNVVVVHDALAFPQTIARWASTHDAALVLLCHSHLAAAANGLPRPLRAIATPVLNTIQARALRVGRVVLVASDTTRQRIADRAHAPIVVSPLGVAIAEFAAARPSPALRARLAGPADTLLTYAGRLSSEKRVELLPDVLAALPDHYVLAIAGAGAARARLEQRAHDRGVHHRLRLLGHIADRRQLATLLATADCFVHPNPDEPFGLAPLEALAAGCRVVAPQQAGSAETLGARGAILVPPNDATALAHGVLQAMGAPPPATDITDCSWDRTFMREWRLYGDLRR
jgi:alpha-1,6-mannosyltransferase